MKFGLSSLAVALQLLPSLLTPTLAAPVQAENKLESRQSGGSYWLESTTLRGQDTYGPSGYTIFRNVMDYGAKGDGSTDDTAAINAAMSDGGRCGWPAGGSDCNSTTVTPAIIYFPAGTYILSTPINSYYMTQMVGNPNDMPTLKATAGFTGMALIDADPYNYAVSGSPNWFINQNNFYRQVRNFIIDLTAMPMSAGAGVHWQVAQATSLQNIVFNMVQGGGSGNAQKGIFMDNGSGGFMSDLVFNGGGQCAFLGSQQFTSRNMTFNNCQTAVYMNWNWGWTLKSLNINGGNIGVDMSNDPSDQTVGSTVILDSSIKGCTTGVKTSFTSNSSPTAGGTLFIDNVDFSGTGTAVAGPNGDLLSGGPQVSAWGQGFSYSGSSSSQTRTQGAVTQASKPASLLNNGAFVESSRPQYENLPASSFQGLQANYGAKGDGTTDDTAAFQNAVKSVPAGSVLYIEHGAYLISDTVTIPAGVQITGEAWPELLITGSSNFGDMNNPKAAIQVGTAGETGDVALSDLVISTQGPVPGAILVEWNLASSNAGASGLWDVQWRIGGADGTNLQSTQCPYQLSVSSPDANCIGSFMSMHITSSAAGVYMENTWLWTADHELDIAPNEQVQIYNGRGLLVESQGPVWLYGTAVEHNVLYNYMFNNASDVYMGMIQTETPYYQPDVQAPAPFTSNSAYNDPTFSGTGTENDAWGLRIINSDNILMYSGGLYSFFQTWSTACSAIGTDNCQENMVDVEGGSNINLYALSTKASINMLNYNGQPVMQGKPNEDNFAQTILQWTSS